MLSKHSFGFLLFFYVLLCILGHFQGGSRKFLSPACWIPGIASTSMCRVPLPHNAPKRAEYARLSQLESSMFENLLDNAAGGTRLSLEIKKTEMAIADLAGLVAHSDLKGRDRLAELLRRFVSATKTAGRGLSRMDSRVHGAVDSVIAVNNHARRTIEAAAKKEETSPRIWPFTKGLATQRVAAKTFGDAMSVLSNHVIRIAIEADVSMKHLDQLEELLTTLHETATRENAVVVADKEELLAQLWTMLLSRNQRKMHPEDPRLVLLRRLSWYRKAAAAHVGATLQGLATMSHGIEELRERTVAAPELLDETVPISVHLQGIQEGLDRLAAMRDNAQLKHDDVFKNLFNSDSEFDGKLEIDM